MEVQRYTKRKPVIDHMIGLITGFSYQFRAGASVGSDAEFLTGLLNEFEYFGLRYGLR